MAETTDKDKLEKKRTLRERIKALLQGRTLDAVDGEDPGEEEAELVQYKALSDLLDQAEASLSSAQGLAADLIADETEDPTKTADDEAAEEEIEAARLESIQALCMQVMGTVQGVVRLTNNLLADDDDSGSSMGIMGLAGRRHSEADLKVLQAVHDGAVELGAECAKPKTAGDTAMALGRAAADKEAAEKVAADQAAAEKEITDKAAVEAAKPVERAACAKCGSVPTDADDPKTCKCGTSATTEPEGVDMNREERIKALMGHEHNPIKDEKALAAASDETLTALEAHITDAEARVAADAHELTEDEFLAIAPEEVQALVAAGRAATAKKDEPVTEEEYLKNAPDSIRTLVAEKKAADAKQKAELITVLKGAQDEFKEDELKKMDVKELARFARAIKVSEPEVDFSGLGMSRAASSGSDDVYANPPDGYATALAKKTVN
jgi:hypothetical protein